MRRRLLFSIVGIIGLLLSGCISFGSLLPEVPPPNPSPPGGLNVSWGVDHYPLNPSVGEPVEFCVWWINSGPTVVAQIEYRLEIDDVEVESGTVPPFSIATEAGSGTCTTGTYLADPASEYRWSAVVKWGTVAGDWTHEFTDERGLCWPGQCGIQTRREKFW